MLTPPYSSIFLNFINNKFVVTGALSHKCKLMHHSINCITFYTLLSRNLLDNMVNCSFQYKKFKFLLNYHAGTQLKCFTGLPVIIILKSPPAAGRQGGRFCCYFCFVLLSVSLSTFVFKLATSLSKKGGRFTPMSRIFSRMEISSLQISHIATRHATA